MQRASLSCRLIGHRFRFSSTGAVMSWRCARGCGAGGSKRYPTAEDARRYAAALDRDELSDLGRRAPLGLFPLRIARALRARRRRRIAAAAGMPRDGER